MSIDIRVLRDSDLEIAGEIARAAYGSPASRKEELAFYLALQPDGWLLAEYEGVPSGIVGAVSYGSFASIGVMAVDPPVQRRGIARALMEDLVAWLDARHLPAFLDASSSGAPLYLQYGFEDRGSTSRYRRACAWPGRTGVSGVDSLAPETLPDVLSLDVRAFNADRGRVIRTYQVTGSARAFVFRETDGPVEGFVFVRSGHIGPLVVESELASQRLLHAALSAEGKSECAILVPDENTKAVELVVEAGFVRERTLRHMWRGEVAQPPRRRDLLYGLASFALG